QRSIHASLFAYRGRACFALMVSWIRVGRGRKPSSWQSSGRAVARQARPAPAPNCGRRYGLESNSLHDPLGLTYFVAHRYGINRFLLILMKLLPFHPLVEVS